jgi:hypothetical protein
MSWIKADFKYFYIFWARLLANLQNILWPRGTVPSGQTVSTWERYHLISLEKDIKHYRFLISLLNIWKEFKVEHMQTVIQTCRRLDCFCMKRLRTLNSYQIFKIKKKKKKPIAVDVLFKVPLSYRSNLAGRYL